MDVIPARGSLESFKTFFGLARGEQLVNAFDLYRALVPQSRFSLEFTVLLMTELARGKLLALSHCTACQGLMVIERIGTPHVICAFCRISLSRAPKPKSQTVFVPCAEPTQDANPLTELILPRPQSDPSLRPDIEVLQADEASQSGNKNAISA